MGIKLDWEIEAEQSQVRNTGEDAESRRRRRQARLRVLLLVAFVVGLFALAAAGVALRLRYIEQLVEEALRATVEAEVTALRIGDRSAFLTIQRSATQDWPTAQDREFDAYQQLKLTNNLDLTARILDLKIDGERARVRVEEIVDGVPFGRVWFYWNYDDGWHHVPPDFTFWGEARTLERDGLRARFRDVDAALASAVVDRMAAWLEQGCAALGCPDLPPILVEIVPGPAAQADWSPGNPWALQIPSPATQRARTDVPFEPALQSRLARLLAERLVAQAMNNLQPVSPADSVFLRDSAETWLADRFAGTPTRAALMQSLAERHGDTAAGELLRRLQPGSDISVLNAVTGTTLDAAGLDWRDFLAWRLNLEQELIGARDEAGFLALYDTADDAARNVAYSRFNALLPLEPHTVLGVAPDKAPGDIPVLRALVEVGTEPTRREVEVVFRLVNGVWKRAN